MESLNVSQRFEACQSDMLRFDSMFKKLLRPLLPEAIWNRMHSMADGIRKRNLPEGYGPLLTLPLKVALSDFEDGARIRGYDQELEASQAVRRVAHNTMISYERAVTLYQQVCHLEKLGVAGALVECGVWKGGAAAIMALANLSHGHRRRELHLFDSFQGLPEPSGADGERALEKAAHKAGRSLSGSGELRPVEWDRAEKKDSESLFAAIGYPAEHVHYHVGWFQETLSQPAPLGDIALLRLDGDWYESTTICLEALYPAVVEGGFVVVDDYGHHEGCRKAVDEYFEREGMSEFLHHIDYTGRYWIRSK